jgi:hypothetical protein
MADISTSATGRGVNAECEDDSRDEYGSCGGMGGAMPVSRTKTIQRMSLKDNGEAVS